MITHDAGLAAQVPRQLRLLDGRVVADTIRAPVASTRSVTVADRVVP
jgi:hypothetical protein